MLSPIDPGDATGWVTEEHIQITPSEATIPAPSDRNLTQIRQRLNAVQDFARRNAYLENSLRTTTAENIQLKALIEQMEQEMALLETGLQEAEYRGRALQDRQTQDLGEAAALVDFLVNAEMEMHDTHSDTLKEIYELIADLEDPTPPPAEETDDGFLLIEDVEEAPKKNLDESAKKLKRLQDLIQTLNTKNPLKIIRGQDAPLTESDAKVGKLSEFLFDWVVVDEDSTEDLDYPGWWESFKMRLSAAEKHYDRVNTIYSKTSKAFTVGQLVFAFAQGPFWGGLAFLKLVALPVVRVTGKLLLY